MSRNRTASWRPVAVAVVLLGCGAGEAPAPDILLVTLDTLRRDHVGAYGSDTALTPELDAFAAGALLHESALTTMPTTAPAHASLFTGLLPSEHGVLRNGQGLSRRGASRELAPELADAGYVTAAFVTSGIMSPRATGLRGFETYDAPKGVLRHGADAVEAALAWLDAEPRRPVFLWVHLYDPHAPYGSADEKRVSIPLPSGAYGWVDVDRYADTERRAMAERYARGVRSADTAFGELLRGARQRLGDTAFVVVASDHGESLDERLRERGFGYDHGEFLDPESVEIVLMLSGPGVPAGRSTGAVSLRDLYGTLRAIAGTALPSAVPRDLRRADATPRFVAVQRRLFSVTPAAAVRRHAAAASDGEHLVIVGENGAPTHVPAGAPAELVELARSRLPERTTLPSAEVDAVTREALESLGYAE